MTALIVIGCVIGYILIGAAVFRAAYVYSVNDAIRRKGYVSNYNREDAALTSALMGLFWPLALPVVTVIFGFAALGSSLMGPTKMERKLASKEAIQYGRVD